MSTSPESNTPIDFLLDVPIQLTVELGSSQMTIKELLQLSLGSVVPLDKPANAAVDILVNGKLVARGEVVVIEDNFGVRITEILSPQERLQRLNDAA